MKRSLSMYTLSAVGAVALMLSACGKKEEPAAAASAPASTAATPAPSGAEATAKKWVDSEFQPSTLSKDQQMAEMKWFIDAAKKLQAKGAASLW